MIFSLLIFALLWNNVDSIAIYDSDEETLPTSIPFRIMQKVASNSISNTGNENRSLDGIAILPAIETSATILSAEINIGNPSQRMVNHKIYL